MYACISCIIAQGLNCGCGRLVFLHFYVNVPFLLLDRIVNTLESMLTPGGSFSQGSLTDASVGLLTACVVKANQEYRE